VHGSFDNGEYVRVQATTQYYNGALQMIAQRVERVDPREIDEADFLTLGSAEVDRLAGRLSELLRGIKDYHLRCLAECFLMDEPLMARFVRAPAGIKNHHAYHGGLLEHVVNLMEVVTVVAPRYPRMNADLLLLGAFLHDIGKVDELVYDREMGYSDQGQLIGHLILAVELLNEKVKQCQSLADEPFPETVHMLLKHMILSHHGEYAFGSPKLPMTMEAIALHFLDNLDAKLEMFKGFMEGDPNTDNNWTAYLPTIDRKLYKVGVPAPEPE